MKAFQRKIRCFTCLWLCFVFLSGSQALALTNAEALKQTLKQAIQTLPQDSETLQETLLKTGEQFEAAGIFSEARRCYQYLDFIWEKFPPADPARSPALKRKITELKNRQDNPVAGTLQKNAADALALFRKEVIPGNFAECRVTQKDPDNVWITVTPADGATGLPDLELPLPVLYTAAALDDRIKVEIPKTAGTYTLKVYSSQGRLLAQENVTVLPEPSWAGKLKIETRGIAGFGGTALEPDAPLDLIVHNTPEWARGSAGDRPWVGLFKKDEPDESKKYLTYWYIKQKTEFTRVSARVKAPGEYELRIFDKDRDDRQILLKTDLLVGDPRPRVVKKGFDTHGEALVFERKQRIRISGNALVPHPEKNPDAFCLLLPAWFTPRNIRHGMTHALTTIKDINTRDVEMALPDAGGRFQLLFYPHWRALKWKTLPEKLAGVTVKESAVPRLALPESSFAPGAVVHAGVMAGDIAGRMTVGILAPDYLQVRADKAGYIMEKKHQIRLEAKSLSGGQGWVDIKAPMDPGKYILALYDGWMLRAALPLTVVPRETAGARIMIPKTVFPTGAPFCFKAFPPAQGMPQHGYASFQKDGQQVMKKDLYTRYLDDPVAVTAPGEPGTYDVLFFVNGTEQPVASSRVEFAFPQDVPPPVFDTAPSPICPGAMAAFKNESLLPGAFLAKFNIYSTRFEADQQIHITYHLPPKVPACLVVAHREQNSGPDDLARTMGQAVLVKELDAGKNMISLPPQEPGDYTLFLYDTLQWTKAGPPTLVSRADFSVRDAFHTRVQMPESACAKGEIVVALHSEPEPGFKKTFKAVYLYPEEINTIFRLPGSSAKTTFVRVTDTLFHGVLPLDLSPGKYQVKIDGVRQTFPLTLTAVPAPGTAPPQIRLSGSKVIPKARAAVDLIPARAWPGDMAFALAGTDSQGKPVFTYGPKSIKGNGTGLIQTTVTAPNRPGTYQVLFWPGTGKEPPDKLPPETVSRTLTVALDPAYAAVHKPDIELWAYFSMDDTLYVDMNTEGRFTASIGFDADAWIGILPGAFDTASATADAARKAAVWSLTLNGKDAGTFGFMAPEEPGPYVLCMYDGLKNGRMVYHKKITLRIPDMAKLEAQANARADAFLESLPDDEEETAAVEEAIKQNYIDTLEVPALTPIPVSSELYEKLGNADTTSGLFRIPPGILSYIGPDDACAATGDKRACEDDIDLALQQIRKVNINFGDGVNIREVVGELAANMTTELALGNEYVAKAKEYYDKAEGYYDKSMKLKATVDKDGWQNTVENALWDSTKSMLESCGTGKCLETLGKKAIEIKLKAYNPLKMTKEEVAAWKKDYASMVILLNPEDQKALREKTAKYAGIAGDLAGSGDPGAKALEMAKAAAINTMKGLTLSMVEKVPGWKMVKAYYETLNILKGALINEQTANFMENYRKNRDSGDTVDQVKGFMGISSLESANHLRTSLRTRIQGNPLGYAQYLTQENRQRASRGEPLVLSPNEIDDVIMGYMETWYQQEKADKKQDGFYNDMKDAWYNSKCKFETYKAQFKNQSVFDAMKELGTHAKSKMGGYISGAQTYSSISCARDAMAFKSYLDLRSQVMEQMAGWTGKAPACRAGTRENLRMQDELTCMALSEPELYKKMLADNAQACGALPKPLPPKTTGGSRIKALSEKGTRALVVALTRSGNVDVIKCLCHRHSVMGSNCSYHPEATKGKSPACDRGGPVCIQGNWGCTRLHPASDAASLEACQAAKVLKAWKKKDNAAYQKWLDQRKQYMSK
ncbi:hypothetical protein [Desulfobacter vibrioformis]|uniref:hypothetical protein n=1 Tax=Desulfobacter vibrioformis TaxID=34031 RepID=UPI00054DD28C|nr:hypothetical protein [Desulfobacter vibrioformis]